MSDDIKNQDEQDTEGHWQHLSATEDEDVEGHGPFKPTATEDEDVEGHGPFKPTATEDDDVEGHGGSHLQ